jgi:hypothetical protein
MQPDCWPDLVLLHLDDDQPGLASEPQDGNRTDDSSNWPPLTGLTQLM